MNRPSGLVLTVAALAVFVSIPLAAETPKPAAAPLGAFSAAADDAFRAWLDTTDLGRMLKRDHSTLKIVRAPDGTEAVIVGEGFRSVIVAQTTQDGNAVATCINTVRDAKAVFGGTEKAPRVRE